MGLDYIYRNGYPLDEVLEEIERGEYTLDEYIASEAGDGEYLDKQQEVWLRKEMENLLDERGVLKNPKYTHLTPFSHITLGHSDTKRIYNWLLPNLDTMRKGFQADHDYGKIDLYNSLVGLAYELHNALKEHGVTRGECPAELYSDLPF